MNHVYSTIVILAIIGICAMVFLASGFDIGDDSDCKNGEVPIVIKGVWSCQQIVTGTTSSDSGIDNNFHINIESNMHERVYLNITGIEDDIYHMRAEPGRHFVISGDQI
jgi:hypothetical protein